MSNISKLNSHLPNILSCMRLLSAPILFLLIVYNFFYLSLSLFIINMVSDVLDGHIARKFDACSKLGGFLDVIGDFSFILISFIALTINRIYPIWVIILVIIMFLQFLFTSKGNEPLYDPIGKHYGSFLMFLLVITLFDVTITLLPYLLVGFLGYTLLSISSRISILIVRNRDT